MKVLLVDDDPSVVAALGAALISEGYDVIQAFNGREAIRHFYTHPDIAIVLLDLCMPVKGGWDTFERITGINPLLPIIIITARSDQYSVADAAGVGALMEKPLDVQALLETMQRLLAEPPEKRLARIAGKKDPQPRSNSQPESL
jgi:DNA-binding NtrC family response regulator